jgi:hypothetical protein
MKRRALIIYCSNTQSGELLGPVKDNFNYREFLKSSIGGNWYNHEVMSLPNPTSYEVSKAARNFLSGADYTFVIFSGHGFVDPFTGIQYLELSDKSIPLARLKTTASRQTLIVDACRDYKLHTNLSPTFQDYFSDSHLGIGDIHSSTRDIFNYAVLEAEPGIAVAFAADRGRSAIDTDNGGAYLLSLLCLAKRWENSNDRENYFIPIDVAHYCAKQFLAENFDMRQNPILFTEKYRSNLFPLFVQQIATPHYY